MLQHYACGAEIVKGRLVLDDEQSFRRAMTNFERGAVILRIDPPETRRTLAQNAYWHAAVFPRIADHCGYTIPECKLVLLGECFGWKTDPLTKRDVPVQPSSAQLTIEQGCYFTDWVIPWAMEHLKVQVPLPHETLA